MKRQRTLNQRPPQTLLGVWAHPDDEAYMSAGLMAEFQLRGDRVVIVTATFGEHGTSDPAAWPPPRLAAHRYGELCGSLSHLGVSELHLLGYEDGGCAQRDGTDAIAKIMADVEPDLIVTFGPDGMTGHPDHRAISRWTTDARAAVLPDADLWYASCTAEFHDRWGAVNDQIDFWQYQTEVPCTDERDLVRSARLTDDLLDLKMAALRAHTSQTAPLIDLVGAATYREWWSVESFRRADLAEASALRAA
jgi:LmbE family N-acetylglucosaminyl deacetylase